MADTTASLGTHAPRQSEQTASPSSQEVLDSLLSRIKTLELEHEVNNIIAKARAEGKLIPVLEEVWTMIGMADITKLKQLAENTPAHPLLAPKRPSVVSPLPLATGWHVAGLQFVNPIGTWRLACAHINYENVQFRPAPARDAYRASH